MGCASSISAKTAPARNTEPPMAKRMSIDRVGNPMDFKKRYRMGAELGRGHFARVVECYDTEHGGTYAMKIIDKKELIASQTVVKEEINILRAVGQHKYIVSLLDVYEDNDDYFLIMDLCKGGDLFSKIVEEGRYSERMAIRVCRQLAEALQYIHKHNISHRDLKPENILLTSDSLDSDIKVADFGLSKVVQGHQSVMKTVCGTWAYCAPEVIQRKPYTSAVDNWTLGVLMFVLLSGYHPFDVYGELPEPQLLSKIVSVDYDFDDSAWDDVSENAKSLIRQLLQAEPEDRLSLEEYLASPWIQGEGVREGESKAVVDRLQNLKIGGLRGIVGAKIAAKKFRNSIVGSPVAGKPRVLAEAPEDRGTHSHGGMEEEEQLAKVIT